MRTIIVGPWLALLIAPAFAAAAVSTPTERELREECSAYSQAGMWDCLTGKLDESRKTLKQAEAKLIAAVSQWDEDPKYKDLARTRFASSTKAFTGYREAQCKFAAALGGGAIGNALDMLRIACETEMNLRRADQLNRAVGGMPPK